MASPVLAARWCATPCVRREVLCVRAGCVCVCVDQNVYKLNAHNYGPDASHTIDTSRPFHVQTSFQSAGGVFSRMTTVLSQDGGAANVTVVHDAATCGGAEYLSSLTDALSAGMTLVLTSWGGSGATMSWLDVPPCDASQACSQSDVFTLANITLG